MPNAVAKLPQVIMPAFDVAMADAANKYLDRARLQVIKSDADYEAMGIALKDTTARLRIAESGLKQHSAPLSEALRVTREVWTPTITAYETTRDIQKKMMSEWLAKKLAEQRRLQQQADELAQKERKRLEALALKADKKGDPDKAASIAQQAAMVVAPVIRTDPPKISGQSVREVWLFQIDDASLIPREYLVPDESKIRRYVNAMKADAKIPGVRIYSEKRIASGV